MFQTNILPPKQQNKSNIPHGVKTQMTTITVTFTSLLSTGMQPNIMEEYKLWLLWSSLYLAFTVLRYLPLPHSDISEQSDEWFGILLPSCGPIHLESHTLHYSGCWYDHCVSYYCLHSKEHCIISSDSFNNPAWGGKKHERRISFDKHGETCFSWQCIKCLGYTLFFNVPFIQTNFLPKSIKCILQNKHLSNLIQLALKLLRASQSSYLFSLFQMHCDQMEISGHCVKFVSVVSSVWLSLWAEMSSSSN